MDIGDEVLDYSESDGEDAGKEETTHVRNNDSDDESTPLEDSVSSEAVAGIYEPPKAAKLRRISEEDELESDEQELDYEEESMHDGVESMVTSQGATDYPFLSSDEEDASAVAPEHGLKGSYSALGEGEGGVQVEGEEEGSQVEGEEGSQVEGEEEGSTQVEGEEERSQVEEEEEGSTQVEGEEERSQVEEEEEGSIQIEGEEEGSIQVEGEEEGNIQVEGEEGSQVEGEEEGSTQVEGEEERSQVEGEEEDNIQVEGEEGSQVGGEEEGSTQVEGEEEGSQVEGEEEGSQVEEEEGSQVEGKSELDVGMEKVEQEKEADAGNSFSSPASDQPPSDPTLQFPPSPSAEGEVGRPSELFGSSDEEDHSISKPKRQRLESDSEADVGATGPFATQEVPEMEEVGTQEVPEGKEVGAQEVPEVKEVGAQEVPEVEEVGTQEVVEQGDEDYVGSASEEGEGGGSDEELAAELEDLTEGEGQVPEKVDAEEEDEAGDQQLGESSEGRPLVYDFDLMMEKRRAQQRRSRKRKRDINDLTADDDIVEDLIGKMRHAAEEDRKLNLAQRAATKKLALLPVLVESLKKSDVVMRFIDAGGLEAISDWLTPLPDHSLPNQKIRETLLDNLRNFPAVDNYTLKKSRIGKAVMLLYRHPKEIRKNKEKAGKLIQEWARPIFGLTSDFKSLSRDEREQRDYAHLTPSVRRRLSSGEEGQRKTGMEIDDALKPGDQGWIGRARVPMPSNKDYVVRPKWNVETEYKKSRKKTMTRYDKQVQKWRDTKKSKGATHAAKLSVAGNKMAI